MNKTECLQLLKKFEGSTFIEYCGLKLENADCGWVRASMPVKEEITNPFGFIHGGAIATLIDTTGGIVCWTVGCKVCTLNLSTSFMDNVKVGHTVFAEANVTCKTNHVIFTEVKVFSDTGDILARGNATMYIVGAYDKIPPRW
ncbi:MAG: PaaI family thioesterase [Acidaminococcaceae bacterium]|nr:PaaI family thioesterase [Acidaminococcaceae bacterium]